MKTNASAAPLVVTLMMLTASSASAQDREHSPVVPDVVRTVLFDPTTYAPAIVAWGATRLDWQTSQVFFAHGSVEHNPRFTVSGRVDDTAISYAAGNRQILTDAISSLQVSVINNASARVMERFLIPRYPSHRTLIRTVVWIEKSAMASLLTYRLSADHFRQWRENERLALVAGY